MLQVRDTGEGIAAEDLPHIWQRFYQGSTQAGMSGAGLGLALVKELMEDENAEARRVFLAEHSRKIKELDV